MKRSQWSRPVLESAPEETVQNSAGPLECTRQGTNSRLRGIRHVGLVHIIHELWTLLIQRFNPVYGSTEKWKWFAQFGQGWEGPHFSEPTRAGSSNTSSDEPNEPRRLGKRRYERSIIYRKERDNGQGNRMTTGAVEFGDLRRWFGGGNGSGKDPISHSNRGGSSWRRQYSRGKRGKKEKKK